MISLFMKCVKLNTKIEKEIKNRLVNLCEYSLSYSIKPVAIICRKEKLTSFFTSVSISQWYN